MVRMSVVPIITYDALTNECRCEWPGLLLLHGLEVVWRVLYDASRFVGRSAGDLIMVSLACQLQGSKIISIEKIRFSCIRHVINTADFTCQSHYSLSLKI
jgi:hypothetical protein